MRVFYSILLVLIACLQLNISKADSTLVVRGTIVEKSEVWNRRSNPMMGRPDWLEEIRLKIEPDTLLSGVLESGIIEMTLSIKEQHFLALNNLAKGDYATFTLVNNDSLFRVVDYYDVIKNYRAAATVTHSADSVRVEPGKASYHLRDSLTDEDIAELLKDPEKIPGMLILKFENLKEAALKKITKDYKLTESRVLTLVSNRGPAVPEGGYVYWGVTGMKNGKWYVWQPGYGLRETTELEDPKRYQK